MSKNERKILFILFFLTIFLSFYLIYKIKSEPEYDKKLYNEIYSEYEEIFINSANDSNDKENNKTNKNNEIYTKVDLYGNEYKVEGKIQIPKIGIQYPIICETSDEYLKIAPTKMFGPNINEVGNLCIVGHNNKNKQFFSKISELEIGDEVYISSNTGETLTYYVYDKYEINENDMKCTSQKTNGNIELTLITCTKKKSNRLVVKCRVS